MSENLTHLQNELQQTDYLDPFTQKPFNISIDDSLYMIKLEFNYCASSKFAQYKELLQPLFDKYYPNYSIDWNINIKAQAVSNNVPRLENIKNIIAVVSGKGGVGKSTTAVNLAIALLQEGGGQVKVGILDADIYGPSIPILLGISGKPQIDEHKNMLPIFAHGLLCNSIGLVVDNAPTIWRGPMATGAFNQLLTQTNWGDLDYLIIDMPPGTGDIQLTLAQKVPVTAAVIVTTPQTVATLDAQKGMEMLHKVNVHIAGVVENMSQHICSNCGHIEHIFAGSGAEHLAQLGKVDILGHLPLDANIGKLSDEGIPITCAEYENPTSKIYRDIAVKLTSNISLLKKDTQHLFKVVAG
ncbi:MAG: hypothetical protein RLZZ210_27 [Pseudomonadota bacterium]|jgi:ATP-binding protein involved in chromosome partitioning